ncbi:MAG: polysaccharide deacetylase family protein [Anaerohalosphaeraceae bacterium]
MRIKRLIEGVSAVCYAVYLKAARRGPQRVVLYYHSLRPENLVSFARQMEYLADRCQVVRACEILSAPLAGKKPLVALTFDDAFVSVQEQAVPVLERLGLTASIFVPVGLLGSQPKWGLIEQTEDQSEKVMSPEDLRRLQQKGFDLYSHTMSHPFLTRLDRPQIRYELEQSRRALEELLGVPVDAVSYPHGDYNRTVLEEAERAGYKWGFTIEPRAVFGQTNPLAVGRFSVSPSEGIFSFRLKVLGAYQVCWGLQKLKKRILGKR